MRLELSNGSFEWDEWNIDKNLIKHNVTIEEIEETFFSSKNKFKKAKDGRYALFGKTRGERYLFIVFVFKDPIDNYDIVRVISARDMNRQERKFYNQKG